MIISENDGASVQEEDSFSGGLEAALALKELDRAYRAGHYISVILLVSLILERRLAGMVYRTGEVTPWRARHICKIAWERGYITLEERRQFRTLRDIRNTYVHFCAAQQNGSLKKRAAIKALPHERLLRQEAEEAMFLLRR